jgi:hypothetical protein
MSICNLGRPVRDYSLNNLSVNNVLSVNNLLKSVKVELGTLCNDLNNLFDPSTTQTLIGSYSTGLIIGLYYNFFYPSGRMQLNVNNTTSSSNNGIDFDQFLYTDQEKIIEDFRVTASGEYEKTQPNQTPFDLTISVITAPGTITAANINSLMGTPVETLLLKDVTSTPSWGVVSSPSGRIPPNSYFCIRITTNISPDESQIAIKNFRLSWSLRIRDV